MVERSKPAPERCDLTARLSQPVTALTLAANHWDELSDAARRDLVEAAKLRLDGVMSVLETYENCTADATPNAAQAPSRLLDIVAALLPDLEPHEVVVRLSGLQGATVALPQTMAEAITRTLIANVLQHTTPPLRIDLRGGTDSAVFQLVGEHDPSDAAHPRLIEPLADPRPADDHVRATRLGRLLRNMLADRHNITITMDEPPDTDRLSITLRLPTARLP